MKTSLRGRGAAPARYGVALVLAVAWGCGDSVTAPDRDGAGARPDPVGVEGITVPAPCRAGECGSSGGAKKDPGPKWKKKGSGGSGAGTGGSGSSGGADPRKSQPESSKRDESKCAAALVVLAGAMSLERASNDVYKLQKKESDAAAKQYASVQRAYAPNGLTSSEARHLKELKATADRERREMQEAQIDLKEKRRAVEIAKAAVIWLCGATGPTE